jgi:Metal-dependent proteases with possible chaperone activity
MQVEFPFLVLLISGGHCLLAVVQSVDNFLLLGQSLDDAPGEAFDKVQENDYYIIIVKRKTDITN